MLPLHHYFDIPPSVWEGRMGQSPMKIQLFGNSYKNNVAEQSKRYLYGFAEVPPASAGLIA